MHTSTCRCGALACPPHSRPAAAAPKAAPAALRGRGRACVAGGGIWSATRVDGEEGEAVQGGGGGGGRQVGGAVGRRIVDRPDVGRRRSRRFGAVGGLGGGTGRKTGSASVSGFARASTHRSGGGDGAVQCICERCTRDACRLERESEVTGRRIPLLGSGGRVGVGHARRRGRRRGGGGGGGAARLFTWLPASTEGGAPSIPRAAQGLLAKLDESRLARWRDDPRRGFGLRRLLPHDGSPAHATTLVVSSRSPRALIAARTTLAAASAGVAAARTCFATRSSERASQTPSEQAMTFAPPGRSNARVHTTGVGST